MGAGMWTIDGRVAEIYSGDVQTEMVATARQSAPQR